VAWDMTGIMPLTWHAHAQVASSSSSSHRGVKGLSLIGQEVELAALQRLSQLRVLQAAHCTVTSGGLATVLPRSWRRHSALSLSVPSVRWLQLTDVVFGARSLLLQVRPAA
jgi:hypothetical protein